MGLLALLRKCSGTLVAVLMTFALLTPTIDSFICIADVESKAAVTDTAQTSAMKQVPVQPRHTDDGDASCIHGHCHHWVGYSRFAERLDFEPSGRHLETVLGLYDSPPSAPKTELLRPPRA